MAPSLTMPESCVVVRLRDGMGGQGDIVPGERCGVWSFHTRDTCWSSMSWSLSSSKANFSRIASANARSLAFDRSLFPWGALITRYNLLNKHIKITLLLNNNYFPLRQTSKRARSSRSRLRFTSSSLGISRARSSFSFNGLCSFECSRCVRGITLLYTKKKT